MVLKQRDVEEFVDRFKQFAAQSAEKKLLFYDAQAPHMCSDEWRVKFKQFLQEGSEASDELLDGVIAHIQLGTLDGEKATAVCGGCRGAFFRLMWLNTDGDYDYH